MPDAPATPDAPTTRADAPSPDARTPDAPPPPDAATPDAAQPDAAVGPCGTVTPAGICGTPTSITYCVVPEGGDPYLQTYACGQGETCQIVAGAARCVLSVECRDGDTQCVNTTQLRTCVSGHWQTSTCPRQCIGSPLGDFCGLNAPTQALTTTLQYEARGPNAARNNWGPLFLAAAPGFLVISARLLQDGTVIPIDVTVTGAAGAFSVQVAATPQPGDLVLVLAAQVDSDHELAVALLDPALPPSSLPYSPGTVGPNPPLWLWSWTATSLGSGQPITITEGMGSGAARVFDYLRYVFAITASRWPGLPRWRLVTWLGGGVSWTCGSCFAHSLAYQVGTWFGGQMWLNGGSDQEYWADAVTAHELGHWTMASYGHEVGEGGTHIIGQPATPGLAWSEGYATWFSADARQDPVYFDKQRGTTFWFDIGFRDSSGSPWPRPVAAAGLYQNIYENEVSAMMWNLSNTQGFGAVPLDAALSSARMTVPPFLRGYTTPYGLNTTFFADYLDALACAGMGAPSIDLATEPLVHYPYPSANPLCSQAPKPPATLRLDLVGGQPLPGAHLALRAQLTRNQPWPFPVTFSFETPADATVTRGGAVFRAGADAADLELELGTVLTSDVIAVAESHSTGAGFRAEARYRFGRPELIPRAPTRQGAALRLGALRLGAPIRGDVP